LKRNTLVNHVQQLPGFESTYEGLKLTPGNIKNIQSWLF